MIVEGIHHIKDGSKQLWRNIRTASVLFKKSLDGETLNRRDRALLVQTAADMFRLVPFTIIVIIPFAELALPFLLTLFPNMLPSTFATKSQKEANEQRAIKAKLEVAKFLQETAEEMNRTERFQGGNAATVEELRDFLKKVKVGQFIPNEQIMRINEIAREPFRLSNLDRTSLKALSKFFGMSSFGADFMLREQLRLQFRKIRKDDLLLQLEGVSSLTMSEVEEAALVRGLRVNSTDPSVRRARLSNQLLDWITLSTNKVPMYLMLLTRSHAFASYSDVPAAETIAAAVEPQAQAAAAAAAAAAAPEATAASSSTVSASSSAADSSSSSTTTASGAKPEAEAETPPPAAVLAEVEMRLEDSTPVAAPTGPAATLRSRVAQLVTELQHELAPEQDVVETAGKFNLSDATAAAMKEIFESLDVNKDGTVSKEELFLGLEELELDATAEEVSKVFERVDADKSGALDFEEFTKCVVFLRELYVRKQQQQQQTATTSTKSA